MSGYLVFGLIILLLILIGLLLCRGVAYITRKMIDLDLLEFYMDVSRLRRGVEQMGDELASMRKQLKERTDKEIDEKDDK